MSAETAEWLPIREVMNLTSKSERSVQRDAADLECKLGDPTNGRPGRLVKVSSLPSEIQLRWAAAERRKVVEIAPGNDAQMALALTAPMGPNLSVEDRAEMDERFRVIEPLVDREKFPLFYTQYPLMRDRLAYLARENKTPERTIYRWLSQWQQGGLPALVRRDRADKGTARAMNDAAKALLLKLATPQRGVYGVLRVAEMWRVYEEERVWRDAHLARALDAFSQDKYAMFLGADGRLTPQAQLPRVSYETFRVWFNRIPEMVRTMARDGEEEYRNSQEIIIHRDYESIRPMEWVVFDHRKLDVFCLIRERGGWKLARPWLTAALDMRTRKFLAWAIVETPSSDSIASVLKKVFVNFGLPGELYWDNGRDYRCEWFEGRRRQERREPRIAELDATWRGVLGTLGIRVRHAIAYNARAKLIEANFNRVSNIDRKMDEWCGHKPGARPERFDDLVKQHERWLKGEAESSPFRTIEQISTLYSAALNDLNECPVEGEGMRKATPTGHGWLAPNEAWDLLIGQVERRTVPVDVLHLCFAKRRDLTVQHGEISMTLGGQPYYYRLSDNTPRLNLLNGKTVQLAYDPLDLGQGAVYYEDRFQGLVSCVTLRHMGEQAFVQDLRDQRAARREVKKAIRAVGAMAPACSLEERLARRAEMRPARSEVPQVTTPAALPAPLMEQAAAEAEEKAFHCEDAPEIASETRPERGSGRFDFFG
jgi:putative transposase